MMNNLQRIKLVELMEKYPLREARMQALADLIENESGKFDRADDAEEHLIIEMRHLGKEILQSWAENASQKKTDETENTYNVKKHSKKKFIG